ncbi:serine/threonine protein kinase [Nonomuraea turcica]|uniref:serine/threonine protein kinase n=1 Tax=Nonomuraea sp. G32 TaxID=3067274 RepID=UPI00273BA7E5|nr:serine/threonine-protein kinase [Nonomuraea sp. G32]MDP4502806.1 protein kinase [Nonomuraea sp. G32]
MAHVEPLREDDPAAVGVYRLLGRLGAGGQGTVYLGQAPDGRAVAVKVLRDGAGFDDRLAKEIEAARRVEPFCIAQVLDASLGRQPYIVTEYVEGPSLQQAGRHTGADLQRLAVATATALAAIHGAGIVHRDFKPANVLLGPGGPRVIDFGIARAADAAATVTSGIVGTPAYMAPEQLAGEAVGPAADVFAWASVMVYAATGTPPFGQDTLPAIINRILHNEPQLGDLPHPLRSIVYGCLAKDPRARPAMGDVLLRLLGGRNSSVQGSGPGRDRGFGSFMAMPMSRPPGVAPRPGQQMPGPGPGAGALPGASHGGRGRMGVPVAIGVSGVVVAALVGGVVWLGPWWAGQAPAQRAIGSPTPPAEVTKRPTVTTSPPRKATRTAAPKPTRTSSPKTTSAPAPSSTPTQKRTTARPAPSPTRSTKKPAASAKISILEIQLSGGPGQSGADGCYMPPVHFQTEIEASRSEIWISYVWEVDGNAVLRNRSWVSEGGYTAFATSGQYMLKAGSHRISLRTTSPAVTSKSISIDVCALETY